jgi:hypothetical protein
MRCALAIMLLFIFSSAQAAIVTYNLEALLSGGSYNGSIITGTVIIDDALAKDYEYLYAGLDNPVDAGGIYDAVLFWEYNTPVGTFNSGSSSTVGPD